MKNREVRMLALEIADEVIDGVKAAGPHGLRIIDGAALVDMDYGAFYGAVWELVSLRYVKVGRGCDGHPIRILLPDAIEPDDIWLSENQRKVLEFLHSEADEYGFTQVSHKDIALGAGVKSPSFCLDRLDVKGYLDRVSIGGPTKKSAYKVYPDGTGLKADTWWLLKYGRRKLIEVAEDWAASEPEKRDKYLAEFDEIEKSLRGGRY